MPPTNVTEWATITSYCATVHKASMQHANKGGGIEKVVVANKEWTFGGQTAKPDAVSAAWSQAMIACKFDISKDSKAEWVGTMTSLLTLMNAFSRRLNEIRVPTTKFPAKMKRNSGVEEASIDSFGLDKTATPFLEGITFAPHIKSSMINSLGPLTLAIGLSLSFSKDYHDKWRRAFKATWGNLDYCEELMDALEGSGIGASGLITQLRNLCFFGVHRTGNKAYIPFVALIAIMREGNDAISTWIASPSLSEESLATVKASKSLSNIDSSGHGMWHAYNVSLESALTMKGPKGTGKEQGQLYTHAFLGTHKDDLSIVEMMTGKPDDFLKRMQIGSSLKGEVGEKIDVIITRYPFNIVCKLSSSAGTALLSGGEAQIQRMAV
jgi:hypothetical protein